jgi:hypothetical protein
MKSILTLFTLFVLLIFSFAFSSCKDCGKKKTKPDSTNTTDNTGRSTSNPAVSDDKPPTDADNGASNADGGLGPGGKTNPPSANSNSNVHGKTNPLSVNGASNADGGLVPGGKTNPPSANSNSNAHGKTNPPSANGASNADGGLGLDAKTNPPPAPLVIVNIDELRADMMKAINEAAPGGCFDLNPSPFQNVISAARKIWDETNEGIAAIDFGPDGNGHWVQKIFDLYCVRKGWAHYLKDEYNAGRIPKDDNPSYDMSSAKRYKKEADDLQVIAYEWIEKIKGENPVITLTNQAGESDLDREARQGRVITILDELVNVLPAADAFWNKMIAAVDAYQKALAQARH